MGLLEPGDLLVLNNTRVTAVRLYGQKPSGGQVEALLLGNGPSPGSFRALVKPGRRLKAGAEIEFEGGLSARVAEELSEGQRLLQFDLVDGLSVLLNSAGRAPLPPYIREPLSDKERYQTVYASAPGSAAAPTAGLHFTDAILEQIRAKGVQIAQVTLDVGLDTFRPVQVEDTDEHVMHGELCRVPQATVDAVRACSGRVIAVGTTATRTLESFAVGPRLLRAGEMDSRLFIEPGYEFQIVDAMFTNFHMPRTTMLLMVSALCSRDWLMAAYAQALKSDYRFLSFGDSMFVG